MTGDSYKIIISLSHRLISFDYWQKEGADRLMPMPQGVWPAPLAFYSNGNEVIVGQGALSAANNGISGAFDSYFELLPRDLKYNLGGHQRDFRFLLTDAAEPLFADFFTNVLFNSYGRLDDNRGYMPITVVCESDIKPQERAAITNVFKSAGYHGVKVVEYDRFIDRYVKSVLARKYDSDKVLVAWSEGKDLTFTLYDAKDSVTPRSATFEDLGVDPRKEYVENLIWESVVSQNPWMNRDNERSAIEKAASDFLASTDPIVTSHVILSDGQKYRYSLTRNSISYLPGDRRADMKEKLDRFMRDNGSDKSRTLLILRGVAANNDYFEQNLRGGFGFTIKSDRELRERVMRQIIDLKDQDSLEEINDKVGTIENVVKDIGTKVEDIGIKVNDLEQKQAENNTTYQKNKEKKKIPEIPRPDEKETKRRIDNFGKGRGKIIEPVLKYPRITSVGRNIPAPPPLEDVIKNLQKEIDDSLAKENWTKLKKSCERFLSIQKDDQVSQYLSKANKKIEETTVREAKDKALAQINQLFLDKRLNEIKEAINQFEKKYPSEKSVVKDLRSKLFSLDNENSKKTQNPQPDSKDESKSKSSKGGSETDDFFDVTPKKDKIKKTSKKKPAKSQEDDDFFSTSKNEPSTSSKNKPSTSSKNKSSTSKTGNSKITNDDFNF